MVGQTEHAAHIGCLYTNQFVGSGISLHQIIEDIGVIQIFRDGNVEGSVYSSAVFFAYV